MALHVGSLLAGRYEITAPIATGGMGEVWKARDQVLDRIVAAKVLKSEYTDDPSFLARFRNEARHTAALSHPNIASVYDYGETTDDSGTQKLAFLVMEFVDGQPLVTILHEEGRLPVDWTLHVVGQSADGLSAAHRAGVVHRDIKPGNLIVRPDGVVKLTDFGIAQARDATPLTKTGMVVGTAQYLSPEQAQGMEVTAASDVYSLGVVAFECLAGVRPFDGASQVAIALAHINRPPPPLPVDVPPGVRLLVERALAKDPADRFADGGAFAEAVRRIAGGGTLAAAGPPTGAGGPVAGPRTTPTTTVSTDTGEGRTQVFATPAGAGGPSMPPVRTPPREDGGWDDDGASPPARRRLATWLAAALVVLLLVGGGVAFAVWGPGGDATDPEAGSTGTQGSTSAEVSTVDVDPVAYVGEPADQVEAALEDLDLEVSQEDATAAQLARAGIALAAGDVAALDPSGPQPVGTEITLFVAEDAFPPAEEDGGDEEQENGENGNGNDEEEEPTATRTRTRPSAPSAPPATTTQPSVPESPDSDDDTPPQEGTSAPPPAPSSTPPAPPTPPDEGAEAAASAGGVQ